MLSLALLDAFPHDDGSGSGRRGRKKRATAQGIFHAAIELMQVDGFDRVSIKQICERADVARATFFQHFANKAALMSVVSDIVCQRLDDDLVRENLTPKDQLRLVADHIQLLIKELGVVAPDIISAYMAEPESEFRVDDPSTGVTSRVLNIIEKGQVDGSFSISQPAENVAISLVAAWVGVSRRIVSPGGSDNTQALHGVLDVFLNGISPR